MPNILEDNMQKNDLKQYYMELGIDEKVYDYCQSVEETLKGTLSQRKITLGAAHGYSS